MTSVRCQIEFILYPGASVTVPSMAGKDLRKRQNLSSQLSHSSFRLQQSAPRKADSCMIASLLHWSQATQQLCQAPHSCEFHGLSIPCHRLISSFQTPGTQLILACVHIKSMLIQANHLTWTTSRFLIKHKGVVSWHLESHYTEPTVPLPPKQLFDLVNASCSSICYSMQTPMAMTSWWPRLQFRFFLSSNTL